MMGKELVSQEGKKEGERELNLGWDVSWVHVAPKKTRGFFCLALFSNNQLSKKEPQLNMKLTSCLFDNSITFLIIAKFPFFWLMLPFNLSCFQP